MIGIDTTFLVQLEIQELPLHQAAHQLLRRDALDARVPLALAQTRPLGSGCDIAQRAR